MATGRRSFVMPHVLETSGSIKSPRDSASGQATGRRSFVMPHVLETSGSINTRREAGSGMATGRRSFVMPHVLETSGSIKSPRDAASGQASGRRSGSIIILDDDGETEVNRYNFFEAWPCRWKAPELNSQSRLSYHRGHVTVLK
jgi:RNase P/RNase MRP subunit POP5